VQYATYTAYFLIYETRNEQNKQLNSETQLVLRTLGKNKLPVVIKPRA
jgi:hypothetical protein